MILLAVLALGAADHVPVSECARIADEMTATRWSDARFIDSHTFTDLAGEDNVHAFVYELSPDPYREFDEHQKKWGVDRYATVITGARYSHIPVIELSNTLPAWEVNREAALAKAGELWTNPQLTGYVYLSPLNEWFEFITDDGVKHLHSRELKPYDLSHIEEVYPTWDAYTAHPGWNSSSRVLLVEENKIEDVPYALWSYGCSPTASSMIFDYWDRDGYPRLVDFYFDRWDHVEEEFDQDLTNVHRELAVAMHTDSMWSGGTGLNNITPGHTTVANSQHGYSFACSTHNNGNSANFGTIIDEIDAGRPTHWAVMGYMYYGEPINHSVTAVGYQITSANDSFVLVHNTWDKGEHLWAHRSGGSVSYVYTVNPNGGQDDDLRLTSFTGLIMVYSGFSYPVTWSLEGDVKTVNIWKASGYKKDDWDLLGTVSDGDEYVVVEMNSGFTDSRINIEGYSGGTLLAADGSDKKITPKTYVPVPHFTPKGHLPPDGYGVDQVILKGTTAYINQGYGGVRVANIFDNFIAAVGKLDAHRVEDIILTDNTLYALGDGRLSTYDISAASSPQLIRSQELSGACSEIAVYGDYVYLGGVNENLDVLRQSGQQFIEEFSIPETVVVDLHVSGDRLYVAARTDGVSVYDLSTPAAPQLVKTFPTVGSAQDVALWKSTLIVAEKSKGVELIDINSGASRQYDLDPRVYDVEVAGDNVYLSTGSDGLLVYKLTGATTMTYLGGCPPLASRVDGVGFTTGRILIAGDFDGLVCYESDLAGVQESHIPDLYPVTVDFITIARSGMNLGSITLPAGATVETRLIDVSGRSILAVTESCDPGVHTLARLPSDVAAGVYFVSVRFVSVRTDDMIRTGKIVVVR